MNAPIKSLLGLAFLALVGGISYFFGTHSSSELSLAPVAPFRFFVPLPHPGFFQEQVVQILEQTEAEWVAQATAEELLSSAAQVSVGDATLSDDDKTLRARSAFYAYLRFAKIGQTSMATLVDLRTKES